MKRKLLCIGALALWTAVVSAQTVQEEAPRKWDSKIESLVKQAEQAQQAAQAKGKTFGDAEAARQQTDRIAVIIRCTDSKAMAAAIQAAGYTARVITPTVVTARVPAIYLAEVVKMPALKYIKSTRRHRKLMDKARPSGKVDKVLSGEGLVTPFTGKGVVIGVIDQGFEYKHIAFRDKNDRSRVIALWDRNDEKNKPIFDNIPAGGETFESDGGHATHVTNIAAGSVISENAYSGVAPEADIIMIPTTFEDAELLEDVHFIDSVATAQGKPWVINMSYGSQIGPHDGSTELDLTMAAIMQRGAGRQMVAAMGNDGDQNGHVSHLFTKNNETVRVILNQTSPDYSVAIDLWGQTPDSTRHLTVKPYLLFDEVTKKEFKQAVLDTTFYVSIDPNNLKENYFFSADLQKFGQTVWDEPQLLLEITGNAGDSFHAWIDTYTTGFAESYNFDLLQENSDYCVGEGAASIPGAIAVGAYYTRMSYKDIKNVQHKNDEKGAALDGICTFSSRGPSLSGEMKPTVVAPGSYVLSAFSKLGDGFDSEDIVETQVQKVKRGNQYYYYGSMEGTSMATPYVTGVVALWLQANPNLTQAALLDIIKQTSRKDAVTGNEEWNATRGYGKIDAYEGLKLALQSVTGIDALHGSDEPVSLSKSEAGWKVLFNSYETSAAVQVYDVNGRKIYDRSLQQVRAGEEVKLSFESLAAGAYVIRIVTPAKAATYKVLVK